MSSQFSESELGSYDEVSILNIARISRNIDPLCPEQVSPSNTTISESLALQRHDRFTFNSSDISVERIGSSVNEWRKSLSSLPEVSNMCIGNCSGAFMNRIWSSWYFVYFWIQRERGITSVLIIGESRKRAKSSECVQLRSKINSSAKVSATNSCDQCVGPIFSEEAPTSYTTTSTPSPLRRVNQSNNVQPMMEADNTSEVARSRHIMPSYFSSTLKVLFRFTSTTKSLNRIIFDFRFEFHIQRNRNEMLRGSDKHLQKSRLLDRALTGSHSLDREQSLNNEQCLSSMISPTTSSLCNSSKEFNISTEVLVIDNIQSSDEEIESLCLELSIPSPILHCEQSKSPAPEYKHESEGNKRSKRAGKKSWICPINDINLPHILNVMSFYPCYILVSILITILHAILIPGLQTWCCDKSRKMVWFRTRRAKCWKRMPTGQRTIPRTRAREIEWWTR